MQHTGNNNPVYQERLMSDEELNLFKDNDSQVILVRRDNTGASSNIPSNIGRPGQRPSNFPTPPFGGQPSQPIYDMYPNIV